MKFHTPENHPIAGAYTHGIELEGRLLFISGQVPRLPGPPDAGPIATDAEGQLRQIWANIEKVLHAAGAELANLVHVRVYLADRSHKAAFTKVRNEVLGDLRPAVTVVICGIWDEAWVAEIEAVAELPGA